MAIRRQRRRARLGGGALGFVLALVLVAGSVHPGALAAQGASSAAEPDAAIVAKTVYGSGAVGSTLVLRKQSIPPLQDAELIRYMRQHPERTSFPNLTWTLVAEPPAAPAKAQLVWLAYDYLSPIQMPRPSTSADVLWSEERQKAIVTVVTVRGVNVTLDVYYIDPTKSLADYPLRLDVTSYEQWPVGASPDFRFQKTFIEGGVCGLRKMSSSVEQRKLVISVVGWQGAGCGSQYFYLDLDTGEWTAKTSRDDTSRQPGPQPQQAPGKKPSL